MAEAIEAVYPDDESTSVALLDHWRAAGDLVKEIHYAQRAGQQLLAASSYPDALAFLRHAIQMAQDCAPDRRRRDLRPKCSISKSSWAKRSTAWGIMPKRARRWKSCCPTARQHGAQVSIAAATRILGSVIQVLGDYQEARRLMRESLAVSESTGDRLGVASALRSLGLISENLGDMAEAIDYYQQALGTVPGYRRLAGHGGHAGEPGIDCRDKRAVRGSLAALSRSRSACSKPSGSAGASPTR